MLSFKVYPDAQAQQDAGPWKLRNAHLVGPEQACVRGEIALDGDVIRCTKKESGPVALALQHDVGKCGRLSIQTCLLPDRPEPYLLNLELARHRLMILYTKLEEWSMFELEIGQVLVEHADAARERFISALCVQGQDPERADALAREALVMAVDATEELALSHAALLLTRRKTTGMMPKHPVGCGVQPQQHAPKLRQGLLANTDYLQLATPWRDLAPEEGDYRWDALDDWAQWVAQNRVPVVAGPVVSFEPRVLPDWVFIWEHDYDTVRDLLYEHIERLVTRYKNNFTAWNIASGLHVNSHFTFNFEQLMDLTRMSTMLVKKVQPAARALVEIRQPFGEYYSGNQRSIPPMMYADLLMQSAIGFDGFSIKLVMGQAQPGQFTRDLMQISSMLDQFAHFGKVIYLTIAAPSAPVTQLMLPGTSKGEPADPDCGHWRRPWSEALQSHWMAAVMEIALSKPFVEGVAWQEVLDYPDIELPLSGLVGEGLEPKQSYRKLVAVRNALHREPELAASLAEGVPVEQHVQEAAAAAEDAAKYEGDDDELTFPDDRAG